MMRFFTEELWLLPLKGCSWLMRTLIRGLRIFTGACLGFVKDECNLRASALTFYTLLSIIPVLAVAFGIAKGFGFEERLQSEVYDYFHDQQALAKVMIDFARNFLQHAQGGIIAGVGVIFLLWSVLKLLGNIENTLNSIWKVPNSRSFLRQFSDYMAIMVLLPIFFVTSSSVTLFITTEFKILAGFGFLPYVLSWILFTLLYFLMPNTRVTPFAALLAGVVGGTLYQVVQWGYIHFQIGVANYGAIYGSFAAFPLFLIWVHLSWLIVLFGAEIAHQTECETMASGEASSRKRVSNKMLATYLVYICATNFKQGDGTTSLNVIAKLLGSSVSDLRNVALPLVDASLLTRTANDLFQPGRPVDTIHLVDIFDALYPGGEVSIDDTEILKPFEKAISSFEENLHSSTFNKPILQLENLS